MSWFPHGVIPPKYLVALQLSSFRNVSLQRSVIMKLKIFFWAGLFLFGCFLLVSSVKAPTWGFFGHRLINKMAVFTLPEKMLPLYKQNIGYITEHAVDPDMRRYATKFEAIRHYIDIDQWDTIPFRKLPRDLNEAMLKFGELYLVQATDSVRIYIHWESDTTAVLKYRQFEKSVKKRDLVNYMRQELWPGYYQENMTTDVSVAEYWLHTKLDMPASTQLVLVDKFTEHGIVPYYLEMAVGRLTNAFKSKNKADILRNSADIGHYIGDAHVPLHTTKNYNGQLSDQVGIHAFWESRLPELYANENYDFFVGKAEYIQDFRTYFWDIITDSHAYLNDVLYIEKSLSKTYPSDQQYCFEERLGVNTRTQCQAYAKAYHEAMQGMVEERMTSSIKSIGDVWYTCWVNAGSPDLEQLDNSPVVLEEIVRDPNLKTREHEN